MKCSTMTCEQCRRAVGLAVLCWGRGPHLSTIGWNLVDAWLPLVAADSILGRMATKPSRSY